MKDRALSRINPSGVFDIKGIFLLASILRSAPDLLSCRSACVQALESDCDPRLSPGQTYPGGTRSLNDERTTRNKPRAPVDLGLASRVGADRCKQRIVWEMFPQRRMHGEAQDNSP
jgi:hypothetical protein